MKLNKQQIGGYHSAIRAQEKARDKRTGAFGNKYLTQKMNVNNEKLVALAPVFSVFPI